MNYSEELRTIDFYPVRVTIDDVYTLEGMLKDYFGDCIIIAGQKKFATSDDFLGYIAKKSIKNFIRKMYCFRRIVFKSPEKSVFELKLLRSRTIITLPEIAMKEGLYRKLIDFLDQRADRSNFRRFMVRLSIITIILILFLSIAHFVGFENFYFVGLGFFLIVFAEISGFIIFRVLIPED